MYCSLFSRCPIATQAKMLENEITTDSFLKCPDLPRYEQESPLHLPFLFTNLTYDAQVRHGYDKDMDFTHTKWGS